MSFFEELNEDVSFGNASQPKIETGYNSTDELVKVLTARATQYNKLQRLWSWIIAVTICASMIAAWTMVFLLGFEVLNFEKHPAFPYTVVGAFFAKTVGWGYIVVKYLFPK
jgi:hypothetical protein